jgi:hypothetical protein
MKFGFTVVLFFMLFGIVSTFPQRNSKNGEQTAKPVVDEELR